jgi:hypothetical protein
VPKGILFTAERHLLLLSNRFKSQMGILTLFIFNHNTGGQAILHWRPVMSFHKMRYIV